MGDLVSERDDELTLPSGEVVRFRAQVSRDPEHPERFQLSAEPSVPVRAARLSGAAAARIAALTSVVSDLRFAADCTHRLVGRAGLDALIAAALWRAALIAYRRCFTTGRRNVRPAVPGSAEFRSHHEAFVALADGHIAHQVDRFEGFDAFVIGDPVERPEPVGIHVIGAIHQLGTAAQVQQLATLVEVVLRDVEEDLQHAKAEALAEARSLPAEELFAPAPPPAGRPMSEIGGPTATRGRWRRRT